MKVAVGATQFEIALASRFDKEACRKFQSYQLVQHSLIQHVLEEIDGRYLYRLRNRVTCQLPANIRLLILIVFLLYCKTTPQQLNTKKVNVESMDYQLSDPINVIFSAVEDLQELVELSGRPFTPQKIVYCGYLIVLKHRIFRSDIRKWFRGAAVDQTWPEFKAFFL